MGISNLFVLWKNSGDAGYGSSIFQNSAVYKRACTGQLWSYHADALGEMSDYAEEGLLTGIAKGRIFGSLCLFLWGGYIVQELRDICRYVMLLSLPPWISGVRNLEY